MKSLRNLGRVAFGAVVLAVVSTGPPAWARVARPTTCRSAGQIAARTNGWRSIDLIDAGRCWTRTLVEDRGYATSVTDPVWSPRGDAVAYGWTHWDGPIVDVTEIRVRRVRDGRQTTALSLPVVGSITEIDWSPDGRRFAFGLFTYNYPAAAATWTTLGSTERIYAVNVDGTGLRMISTINASFDVEPRWAPDSTRLAYTSWLPTPRVVVVDTNAALPRPTFISPADVLASSPVWSPTGKEIAFLANQAPGQILDPPDLWVTNVDDLGAHKILRNVWSPAAWSPDGRFLVAASSEEGAQGLWMLTPRGGRARRLTFKHARAPAWSPNGRIISFIRPNGVDTAASAQDAVWTVGPDGRGARQISEGLAGYSAPVWRPS